MAAGGSARQEHDRRRARDRARRRAGLRVTIPLVVGLAAAAFVAVQVGAHLLNTWAADHAAVGAAPKDVVPPSQARLLGMLAALGVLVSLGREAWGRPPTTEAYGIGADGEEATARLLQRLERKGFVVLHDRRIPGARENLDHVVIGPSGVSTIETKSWSGKVRITRTGVLHNGRSADAVIAQAKRQAAAVQRALPQRVLPQRDLRAPLDVRPVVVVHRAPIELSRLQQPLVDGVRWCGPRRLTATLRSGPTILSDSDVREIAAVLDRALPAAAPTAPPTSAPKRPRAVGS